MKGPMCAYVALNGEHGYVTNWAGERASNCLDCGHNPAAPVQWLSRLWNWMTR